jgi:hypothetical protein
VGFSLSDRIPKPVWTIMIPPLLEFPRCPRSQHTVSVISCRRSMPGSLLLPNKTASMNPLGDGWRAKVSRASSCDEGSSFATLLESLPSTATLLYSLPLLASTGILTHPALPHRTPTFPSRGLPRSLELETMCCGAFTLACAIDPFCPTVLVVAGCCQRLASFVVLPSVPLVAEEDSCRPCHHEHH